jgi:hypothetical protein
VRGEEEEEKDIRRNEREKKYGTFGVVNVTIEKSTA